MRGVNAHKTKAIFEADGTRHDGWVEAYIPDEAAIFCFSKPGIDADNISVGDSNGIISIRLPHGSYKNYRSEVIKKKLPRILVSFRPEGEDGLERKHPRVEAHNDTPIILLERGHEIVLDHKNGTGIVKDISGTGASIYSDMLLGAKDKISFSMSFDDSNGTRREMNFTGRVMNSRKMDGYYKLYGVTIESMDKETSNNLRAYLDGSLHPKGSGK